LIDGHDVTPKDGEWIGARAGRYLGDGSILGCEQCAWHEKIVSRGPVVSFG